MSRLSMQIAFATRRAPHLLQLVAVGIGGLDQLFRSTPRAFLAHAFGAHWQQLLGLLDQPEAHGFATAIASREQVAFTHQHFVRHAMSMMNDLIDAALGAEFTRRKLFSASGAFHRKLPE